MLSYVMEYSVAALFVYVAVGFVLLSAATILGASPAVKERIPKASASTTALTLACSLFFI
jgi:hypothetical protein